jgi:hypothetical protein
VVESWKKSRFLRSTSSAFVRIKYFYKQTGIDNFPRRPSSRTIDGLNTSDFSAGIRLAAPRKYGPPSFGDQWYGTPLITKALSEDAGGSARIVGASMRMAEARRGGWVGVTRMRI